MPKKFLFVSILLITVGFVAITCDKNSTEPMDCAGVKGGSAFEDDCGECVGGSTGLAENYLMDCAGICAGEAIQNDCGCVGGTTGLEGTFCYGCTDILAVNFNPEAVFDDGSCEFANTVIDLDGNIYTTTTIGTQEWFVENLRVTQYKNGDPINQVSSQMEWSAMNTGAYSYYNNNSEYDDVYGKLYNWYAAADNREICPEGWHVPTDSEFIELEMALGMSFEVASTEGFRGSDEGGKLKETGTDHWNTPNTGATNESGFTAVPGGYRSSTSYGTFNAIGLACNLWIATSGGPGAGWQRSIYHNQANISRLDNNSRSGFSIRCVAD